MAFDFTIIFVSESKESKHCYIIYITLKLSLYNSFMIRFF